MEKCKIKCSYKEHEEIDSIAFCPDCKVYMCIKCENFHSKLLQNHQSINLDKNSEEIFTGFCKEEKHQLELEFFCKTHNQLCCAACLCKVKKNNLGNHIDCNVCAIEDIKEEKNNKFNENIKFLEELSNNLQTSINNFKIIFEKISENKEELKTKIQNIFTKIRKALNNREEELLTQVDEQFENLFFKEDFIHNIEKYPKKIKHLLEKNQIIIENKNIKLNFLINNYSNLETSIIEFGEIKDIIKKCKDSLNIKIIFHPKEEKELNLFLKNFLSF